jgi:hypothetical protein
LSGKAKRKSHSEKATLTDIPLVITPACWWRGFGIRYCVTANSRCECQIQTSTRKPVFASGPVILTFAGVPPHREANVGIEPLGAHSYALLIHF